ncbi:MAG: hypothetical protein PVH48_01535 [Cyclobacteriaceae bacterium]
MRSTCLTVFILISFIGQNAMAQKMFWNDMTADDKEYAIDIANKFKEYVHSANNEDLKKLVSEGKIYTGDGQWIDHEDVYSELKTLSNSADFSISESIAYTFDEFLDNHTSNILISRCYDVFDNHSVLVVFNFEKDGKIEECLLSIRKNRNSTWKIRGIIGLLSNSSDSMNIDTNLFREEKISDIGISILIPREFDKSDHLNGQTIYYYEGKSGRDAAIQVMMDDLKAKIYYYTYKFVEHNNQQFKMSNLVVKYVPAGIKYEYEVIDPGTGTSNKGITVGMERSGKVVLIQYYSFLNVYKKIKSRVDYTLSNVIL